MRRVVVALQALKCQRSTDCVQSTTEALEKDIMAGEKNLLDAFIDELRDSYDGEKQLLKALPKLAKAATTPGLAEAFSSHLEETREHVARLEQAFELLDERARGKHCEGIAGIVEEGHAIMEEDFDEQTMDACLIAAGQRAEHYEIAAYGTLVAWAEAMGHDEVATLLKETLEEEKAADEKLTELAEGGINQQAGESAHAGENDGGENDDTPEPARSNAGKASKSSSRSDRKTARSSR
jgi:ferritin-like metal-binding protein YciE